MKAVIIILAIVLLAAAYFLWFAPTQAPSGVTGATDNVDALTAGVLQDGSADLTTPLDTDPTLTQSSAASGQADTYFGANQF